MKTPSSIIRLAHNLALKIKPVRNQRVVAIMYNKRYVFGVGIASMKTHPLQQANSKWPYLHAEIDAARNAINHTYFDKKVRTLDIYVHRIRTNGVIALAKPCIHCEFALKQVFNIRNVDWSK
jgi:hypothetical protein